MVVAEDDESGGVHNHNYSIVLLNDAIAKLQYIVTGIKQTPAQVPLKFALMQNYPNPFNPTTVISYQLQAGSFVTLKVYDILGREVRTLVNEHQNVGDHLVTFNASDLPSGIYFYRIVAGRFSDVKKLVLLK